MKDFLSLLLVFEFLYTFALLAYMFKYVEERDDGFIACIRFIKDLFKNKNLFGIILGVIIFIISIPYFIFVLITEIISNFFMSMYNLGNKKEDK
jgi:hypothetical protein